MSVHCTEAEWKIMEVLWEASPRTMPEITKELSPVTGWTRHTVITLLKRMQEKGAVRVDDTGKVKTYTPCILREDAARGETRKLLNRAFGGKASLLVHNLVDSGEISLREMEDILALLKTPKGGD